MAQVRSAVYGSVQEVQFDGKKGVSQPDIYQVREHRIRAEIFFRQLMFMQHKRSSLQQVLSALLSSSSIRAPFPNLAKLAGILIVLPVTKKGCNSI